MSRPPRHLADLELAERREAVAALGERSFRADQLSRHYFGRYTDSPEDMTDLPVGKILIELDRMTGAAVVLVSDRLHGGTRGARRYEVRHPPFQPQAGRLALQQRFEGLVVGHAFVDFHVGGRIVTPAHPPSANTGLDFDLFKKIPDG